MRGGALAKRVDQPRPISDGAVRVVRETSTPTKARVRVGGFERRARRATNRRVEERGRPERERTNRGRVFRVVRHRRRRAHILDVEHADALHHDGVSHLRREPRREHARLERAENLARARRVASDVRTVSSSPTNHPRSLRRGARDANRRNQRRREEHALAKTLGRGVRRARGVRRGDHLGGGRGRDVVAPEMCRDANRRRGERAGGIVASRSIVPRGVDESLGGISSLDAFDERASSSRVSNRALDESRDVRGDS